MSNRLSPLEHAFPRRTRPLLTVGLVVGDPFLEATGHYLNALVDGGADVIELILPFSDPLFHGPVLRRACERAMGEKISWDDIETLVRDFRRTNDETPLVVTSYFNRVLARGEAECTAGLAAAGADGLMVVDLPREEAKALASQAEQQELSLIQAVGPTTGLTRFREIARGARGFLLWTGHSGKEVSLEAEEFHRQVKEFRKHSTLPLVVSHNVETGEEAARIAKVAHGVLVSSSVAWLIEGGGPDVEQHLRDFVADIRASVDAVGDI
jgi:tryptophan synthase alpha chain